MNAPLRPEPADPSFAARAAAIKPGRTLSITHGEVYAERGGAQTPMMPSDTPDTPE